MKILLLVTDLSYANIKRNGNTFYPTYNISADRQTK